ncbi:MAG: sulfurtransferase-like selenium metabolism protein YedF [Anaerolineae bacterium]|nr:sulfurtransferase-like selenium metabolism protein YedF [Anaerolineae bacterium]
MAKLIDARGLPCPQPVILTRNALKESNEATIIVDNETAQQNVTRMAQKAGYAVQAEQHDDDITLHIGGKGTADAVDDQEVSCELAPSGGPLVLVVSSEFMGRGEHDELGNVLIRGFFHTLGEVEPAPETIIFFNSGVKLTIEGSPILEDLVSLSQRGIELLACGTCLGYYEIADKLAVGEVSNMYTIAETMLNAGKVVQL